MFDFTIGYSMNQWVFFISAVVGGIITLFNLVSIILGFDFDADIDIDVDVDIDGSGSDGGLKWFSLHGLGGFFLILGLVGLACYKPSDKMTDVILYNTIAFGSGFLMAFLTALLFKQFKKLNSVGTVGIDQVKVGQVGTVYMRIAYDLPGKVTVIVNNIKRRTYIAQFDDTVDNSIVLNYGDAVQIVNVIDDRLIIKPIK